MLKDRVLSTMKFFDLQDFPLTLFELHEYLISNPENLKSQLNSQWELAGEGSGLDQIHIPLDTILQCLESECQQEVVNIDGFYCFAGRQEIVKTRLANYLHGIEREKLIKRFSGFLARVPFIRGVALAGSQAMGQQKVSSDIDLFIITAPEFLWVARTLVTAYFQLLGRRRHGKNIANRFCLNHYITGPKKIEDLRNLYTAWEYAKLRPLIYPQNIVAFQQQNSSWIRLFFPNFQIKQITVQPQSFSQRTLEKIFTNKFGKFLEEKLKNWQLPKIRQEKFIVVQSNELSFHPESKQQLLLTQFFSKF